MNVFRQPDALPSFRNSVITIGTFDGVHKGHQAIIRSIVKRAGECNGESIIVTFHPHPRNIIQPGNRLYQLNALDEKLELLENLGVDHVVVVPFSREFSEMEADAYVNDFLIDKFNPAQIVIGYDHRFGKDRSGDIDLLEELAAKRGVEVHQISRQELEDIAVSSTRIRKAVIAGEVESAARLLGYPYRLSGHIIKGDTIGRTLGYPTANLGGIDHNKLLPGLGIYAVRAYLLGKEYNGMMSIGMRPTFSGKDKRLEVHLFDFNEDIYGEQLTVELLHFLRSEKKFNDKDELIAAMQEDERTSRSLLSGH